ncbi:hypothetical protein BBJ28_00019028 [Nothophytophthora sp. Chile5]|nr:hypothetical protein BBJ28_00019028 [Nothophytophthora sp. Chile5]
MPATDVELSTEDLRNAHVATATHHTYASCYNRLEEWIRQTQPKEDIDSFFDPKTGRLHPITFSPEHFADFCTAHSAEKANPLRPDTLLRYRTALRKLYDTYQLPIPDAFGDRRMKRLLDGIRRKQTEKDMANGRPTSTGKLPLTYEQYSEICESTLGADDRGFSHLFLTTQWNMMGRASDVANMHVKQMRAKGDSVEVSLTKTKSRQNGGQTPRHLFANPTAPSMCWITALGVYLACHPSQGEALLFPGAEEIQRFRGALAEHCERASFGTHSIRKGVATFACSGSICGPSLVSVFRRCDWSLGKIQDRYLRYETAGDQFLGRVVAGLPQNAPEFAALPPHFKDSDSETVNNMIRLTFPALATAQHLGPLLRMCLASLVYHADYLLDVLPIVHPLMASYLFRIPSALGKLRCLVTVDDSATLRATGIPGHITVLKKQSLLQEAIAKLPDVITQTMEDKGIGPAAFNATTVQRMLDSMQSLLDSTLKALSDSVATRANCSVGLSTGESNKDQPTLTLQPQTQTELQTRRSGQLYSWGSQLHVVPESFSLPPLRNPLLAWNLWWFGNERERHPPYRLLKPSDFTEQSQRTTFNDWSAFMKHVRQRAENELGRQIRSGEDMTEEDSHSVFEAGFTKLPIKPLDSGHERILRELSVTTLLRLIREGIKQDNPDAKKVPFQRRKRPKHAE